MNFLFEKRKDEIWSEILEAEKMLYPFKLPLDYKLFISFFELTPTLLKFDEIEGEFLNNPDGKMLISFNEEKNVVHVFPQKITNPLTLGGFEFDHDPKGYFPIAYPNIPNGTILLSLKKESYGKVFHTEWGWINEVESEHWTLLGNSFGEYITSFEIVEGGVEYPTSI